MVPQVFSFILAACFSGLALEHAGVPLAALGTTTQQEHFTARGMVAYALNFMQSERSISHLDIKPSKVRNTADNYKLGLQDLGFSFLYIKRGLGRAHTLA